MNKKNYTYLVILLFIVVAVYIVYKYVWKEEEPSEVLIVEEPTILGKVGYSKYDGLKVYSTDWTIYKVAKEGEWIGTVKEIFENGFYKVSGNKYVYGSSLDLK